MNGSTILKVRMFALVDRIESCRSAALRAQRLATMAALWLLFLWAHPKLHTINDFIKYARLCAVHSLTYLTYTASNLMLYGSHASLES